MEIKVHGNTNKKRCYEFGKPKRYGHSLFRQKTMTYIDYLEKSGYKNKDYWIRFYKSYKQQHPDTCY